MRKNRHLTSCTTKNESGSTDTQLAIFCVQCKITHFAYKAQLVA